LKAICTCLAALYLIYQIVVKFSISFVQTCGRLAFFISTLQV